MADATLRKALEFLEGCDPLLRSGGQMNHELRDEIRARLQAGAGGGVVANGWKLAPIEPTDEMVAAWPRFNKGAGHERAIYTAMIAAAPTPPASVQPTASVEGVLKEARAIIDGLDRMFFAKCGGLQQHSDCIERIDEALASLTPAPTPAEDGGER
jgi:hypothetical protein